jgi:Xaa-Pro aminopeptidase
MQMTSSRLTKLRAAMAERQLDGLVIAKPENRAYMSGFEGSAGHLFVTGQNAYLLTDFRYTEQAGAQAPDYEIITSRTAHAEIASLSDKLGIKRIGYEGDFMNVDDYEIFRKLHLSRTLVSATSMVERLRMIKDASEITRMRRAAAIADEAWSHILGHIKPGVVERDLALELEFEMKRLGADGLAFDIIVASGVRSALPHGRASEKVILTGELLTFDFGAIASGYCSDMTRTVMVGEPTSKQREIYGIVLEAQLRGVAACRAGMTGKELDAVCRDYIAAHGYGDAFGHGTGHAVGRFIHEGPRVSAAAENDRLEAGMVVTIEPGIYLPGWGGVRIEDMVLVTEQGCERLSQSPKELLLL